MAKIDTYINLKEVIKSILFVSGEGVRRDDVMSKIDVDKKEFDKAVAELKAELSKDSGIHLIEYKDKIQLSSNPNYSSYISDVLNPIREKALTKAALETIAIVAYKQPITKTEIEEIRGVNSDYSIDLLLEQNMVEIVGRKDAVGKPMLFGTTEEFLKRFNLKDIDNLPNYDDLLERIKVVREPVRDSLYNDFELPPEEDIPDFLRAEADLESVSTEEVSSDDVTA